MAEADAKLNPWAGANFFISEKVIKRESPNSRIQVEYQYVEAWRGAEKLPTQRFCVWRCMDSGKILISNVETVTEHT
jgi:hypothetical protein